MNEKDELLEKINAFYNTSNIDDIFEVSISKIDKTLKDKYKILLKNVDHFPIDLESIIKDQKNFKINKVTGIKKGSIKYSMEKDIYIISIASNYGKNSERFSLAHELGHYFMDRDILLSGKELQSNFASQGENNNIEIRANDFAIKLLTPIEIVKKIIEFQNNEDYTISKLITDMQFIFGLSEVAITNRLEGLGVIK